MNRNEAGFAACARIARLAALRDLDGLRSALTAASAQVDDLATTLRRYQLGPLVERTLAGDGSTVGPSTRPDGLLAHSHPEHITQRELLEAYADVGAAMHDAGIPVLLLKGAVLADGLYGGLDHRPQYDIDVLVRPAHVRAARRLLISAGYRRRRRDGHSVSFVRDAIQVDLHHALRSSPAYGINDTKLWERARSAVIAGTTVQTLADIDTLSLLTMSVIEDVGFGMAKLKNLCDIWLLILELEPVTDWDAWFSARAEENLEAVALNGCVLALLIMGSPGEAPSIEQTIARRRPLLRLADRAQGLALMTAERGSAANMAWFGEVYPGSLIRFRAHSFVSGWPDTLRALRPGRIAFQREIRRSRRVQRSEWSAGDRS